MRKAKWIVAALCFAGLSYCAVQQWEWSAIYNQWDAMVSQRFQARIMKLCPLGHAESAFSYYRQDMAKIRLLAEKGDDAAQCFLAEAFRTGTNGFEKNEAQALPWAHKSADHGNAIAQWEMGELTKDKTESVAWYRKAAVQGDMYAQYSLGVAYLKGKLVTRDDAEAVKWLRRAAQQGEDSAQWDLAGFYQDGTHGLPKDAIQSYMWRWVAIIYGRDAVTFYPAGSLDLGYRNVTLSERWLKDYRNNLTAEQLAEAEKRARAWKPEFEPVHDNVLK